MLCYPPIPRILLDPKAQVFPSPRPQAFPSPRFLPDPKAQVFPSPWSQRSVDSTSRNTSRRSKPLLVSKLRIRSSRSLLTIWMPSMKLQPRWGMWLRPIASEPSTTTLHPNTMLSAPRATPSTPLYARKSIPLPSQTMASVSKATGGFIVLAQKKSCTKTKYQS